MEEKEHGWDMWNSKVASVTLSLLAPHPPLCFALCELVPLSAGESWDSLLTKRIQQKQ